MVRGQEGVVLQGARKGLPWAGRRRLRSCRNSRSSLRLQCRLRQLDGGMERTKEGLVLPQCRQGLPTSSWRLRLKVLRGSVSGALEGRWRLRAIFRRFSQHASARSQVRA